MLIKQFHDNTPIEDYALIQYKYLFVMENKGQSRYNGGPNLFGWGDKALKRYTNKFHLELVYG